MQRPTTIDDSQQLHLDYLSEVIRFRISQETNLCDTGWAQNTDAEDEAENQITYLADANVFFFYFQAASEHHHANPLRRVIGRISKDEDFRLRPGVRGLRQHKVSPAVITAQFIFSGKLPGQCDFPLYYFQEHGEEFQGRISRIMNRVIERKSELTEEQTTNLKRETRGLVLKLKSFMRAPVTDEAIRGIRKILDTDLPQMIRHYDLEHIDEALHLLQLVQGGVAQPLRLAPRVDRSLLDADLPEHLVQEWRTRLEAFHPEELYQSRRHSNDDENGDVLTDNIEVDAKVLARLELLNASMKEQALDNRFVLITTSNALISANAYWLKERDFDLNASLVRSAHQFVPMANFHDIENFSQDTKPSQRLRTAMDGLFTFFFPSIQIEKWPHALQVMDLYIRNINRLRKGIESTAAQDERRRAALSGLHKERLGALFERVAHERIDAHFHNIAEAWIRLINNSVGVNAQQLIDYYSAHLEEISLSLDAVNRSKNLRDSLGQSYTQEQKTLAQRIALGNLQLSTNLMMGGRAGALRRLVEIARVARPHVYLEAQDADILYTILQAARDGDTIKVERALTAFIETDTSKVAERALTVATVALQLGFWANAASFARMACSLLEDRKTAAVEAGDKIDTLLAMEAEALWMIGTARRVALSVADTAPSVSPEVPSISCSRALARQAMAIDCTAQKTDFVAQTRSQAEMAMLHIIQLLMRHDKGTACKDEDFATAADFGRKAMFGAHGILNDPDQNAHDKEVIRRTRLLGGVAMVMMWLLAIVQSRQPDMDLNADADKICSWVLEDTEKLGAANYDSWPLLVHILQAFRQTGGQTVEQLQQESEEIDTQVKTEQSVATEMERKLAAMAIATLKQQMSTAV